MKLTLPLLGCLACATPLYQQQTLQSHNLISLHKQLVDIPSLTGDEQAVSTFLQTYLTSLNFTVELQQVAEGRHNVFAYYGAARNTSVLLTSHIDTVPPYIPYYQQDDKIYGRGSADAKASVAAQIVALDELHRAGEVHEGDVSLLYVVGEEYDGIGMGHASDTMNVSWDHAIFGEPTELQLGVGHKGILHFDIEVLGKSAHSGYPQLGIDASKKLIDLLYAIEHAVYPDDGLLGSTTVNVGVIKAGFAGNVVSPRAFAKVLIRVAHDATAVRDIIDTLVMEHSKDHDNIRYKVLQSKEPVYLDYQVPGFNSTVLAYFTDVPNLDRHFKSRYLYGPGSILVAHSADEFVTVDDLTGAVGGYKKLVKYLVSNDAHRP